MQDQLVVARKKLQLSGQQKRRMKSKLYSLTDLTKVLQKKLLISTECAAVLDTINDVPRELQNRIQKKKKSAAFSEELKQFATTLHFYSPKAYDFVREKFSNSLPHPQKIRKWYGSVSADPGFTVASFTALESRVSEKRKEEKETICSSMIDEMHIHQQIEFGVDQIHGYVDFGVGEIENTVATQALVLMVVAINESWRIPIGYFLISSFEGKHCQGEP